jgi:hypothetical protein
MEKFIEMYGCDSRWPAKVEENEVLSPSEVDAGGWDQPIDIKLYT